MSVSIPSENPCSPPSCQCSRALRIASRLSYAIWGLVSIAAIICTLFAFLFALQFYRIFDFPFFAGSPSAKDVVSWTLSSVQLNVSAIVLWHVRRLFEGISESDTPFGEQKARRMRLIAATLALGLLAAWSVAFAFSAAGEAQVVGLAFPIVPLFDIGVSATRAPSEESIALYLDFSGVLLAALAWGLSFIFEYGVWLKRENDQVV